MTHELKSPIASLQLAAETIALRRPEPARLDALVKRMRGDIRRLEDMVGRILDTATLEAGRPHLRKERLPLARVVAGVAEEFAERAAERAVRISQEIPAGLEIAADPAAANTVLRNLIENALRASAAGGGTAGGREIRLTARAHRGFVELEVADDGVGFDPARGREAVREVLPPGRRAAPHQQGNRARSLRRAPLRRARTRLGDRRLARPGSRRDLHRRLAGGDPPEVGEEAS